MSPAATLVEALEPIRADPAHGAVLLDIDGTLAPIVRHAADAHVPEATRTLLIEIAKRYGIVGCVSGRRASTARQIVAIGTIAYVGQPRRRAAAPGRDAPARSTPELAAWTARVRAFAASAYTERAPATSHPQRGQGRDRGVPLARRARRGGRRRGGRASSPRAPSRRASRSTGGARCSRCARRSSLDKGLGVAALLRGARSTPRCTSATTRTDLDAFRGLREQVRNGALQSALCVAVSSDEAPAELAARPT